MEPPGRIEGLDRITEVVQFAELSQEYSTGVAFHTHLAASLGLDRETLRGP